MVILVTLVLPVIWVLLELLVQVDSVILDLLVLVKLDQLVIVE
jgi:hypothetical protein